MMLMMIIITITIIIIIIIITRMIKLKNWNGILVQKL